jgi:hypothetical protein
MLFYQNCIKNTFCIINIYRNRLFSDKASTESAKPYKRNALSQLSIKDHCISLKKILGIVKDFIFWIKTFLQDLITAKIIIT